jgi:hypothetical protein
MRVLDLVIWFDAAHDGGVLAVYLKRFLVGARCV